ncbi:hypothetical protein ACLOJK_023823 [Asimina triloba]
MKRQKRDNHHGTGAHNVIPSFLRSWNDLRATFLRTPSNPDFLSAVINAPPILSVSPVYNTPLSSPDLSRHTPLRLCFFPRTRQSLCPKTEEGLDFSLRLRTPPAIWWMVVGISMAVQAQYPSNSFRARNVVLDELQQFSHLENQNVNLLRACNNYAVQQQILNGAVFSDPGSELTCNASGSRKRSRVADQMPLAKQQQISPQFIGDKSAVAGISTGLQLSYVENRLMESAATSTSGRCSAMPLSQDLSTFIFNESIEIDALIRLQSEKLRSGLEETHLRHYRSLLALLEQRALKSLREKERELDGVRRKNAELEEKVKQMAAENQIWCHVARNNEAMVSNLRSTLEQLLLQNSAAAGREEGYGDSGENGVLNPVADDAGSCCYEEANERAGTALALEYGELKYRKTCKACRANDVSVLLLPCRHLCLCKDCESTVELCPLCGLMKNGSLQIFMS